MSESLRAMTPDSQLTSSLHRATTTIDELTHVLTNASRVSSPEPENVATCCCGREDCETSRSWALVKTKLEGRLSLSAEVGRALLQRHEALVRRQGRKVTSESEEDEDDTILSRSSVDVRVGELVKQNAVLEKRLTQALMHTELGESSKKTILQELEEARADVARLSSHNARAVGLENRLAVALQEQDDLKQELESATQRARMTEARTISYREKCAKLQAQVARLKEDLDSQRTHRQELSQEILSDAKQRLEQLQYHQLGHSANIHDVEVTKVLESLVADNEALKRDNAELQNLLGSEREELHSLQEELEERRASDTPFRRSHRFTNSANSLTFYNISTPMSPTFHVGTAPTASVLRSRLQSENADGKRSMSAERSRELSSRRPFEPLTPETERRPLSPDSHIHSGTKWTSFANPRSTYAHSHISVDDQEGNMLSPERPRAQKPLLLLTRERGVQTDFAWSTSATLAPSRAVGDHMSSHDGRSESSSMTDNIHSSAVGAIVERATTLLNRMVQADALTLTNRLKRQHLLGADVEYLSRTTVGAIHSDAAALRLHFRAFLEDEKMTTTCTRRDLRGLLKLIKDVFTELGELRVTLNTVILDPSVAGKVSEIAMHPSKAQAAGPGTKDAIGGNVHSWMAPFSKLLGLPGSGGGSGASASEPSSSLSPTTRNIGRGRPPPRIAPKLQPALSASAMTVNVEFSGAAVGRAVTSTYSAHPGRVSDLGLSVPNSSTSVTSPPPPVAQPVPRQDLSKSVMGIFAGAPRAAEGDPWVMISRPPVAGRKVSRMPSTRALNNGSATIGRASVRGASSGKRLSRIVDAIIDSPQPQPAGGEGPDDSDGPPVALDRALRRGLSDSSINTTFTQHGDGADPDGHAGHAQPADRESVLQALSRKIQVFRFMTPTPAIPEATASTAAGETFTSRPHTPVLRKSTKAEGEQAAVPESSPPRPIPSARAQSEHPNSSLFDISSWTAAYPDMQHSDPAMPTTYFTTSPREEGFRERSWRRERDI